MFPQPEPMPTSEVRSTTEAASEPAAEALKPTGTWIVKALPRPPLVAAMLQQPPGDELLANDSLGG